MTAAWFFDCDGTLVEFTAPYDEIFADACVAVGVTRDDAASMLDPYNEAFFAAFDDFHPEPYCAGMAAALEETGLGESTDADAATLAESLCETETTATTVRDGTVETLDALAERGVALGVLTNGVATQQRRKLERHGLFDRFDAYVPSYEAGAHKPDPEPFAVARERLPADEYVYVGDSADHDIAPAREAGFHAVHVDHDAERGVATVRDIGALGGLIVQR
ncbi:HAD family hydrolase [Halobaculum sp. CBA1158]|uniref:HAD family hydrolase n=1 Tax=Halobaculum sp. CBA1158 TaxID=2904243 RepID=UPI001F35D322|nr:HAD family hydrolase [Halobaculum sp. CBA1158]UIO99928.1 HAD family hydrolase [Halobaculum sp. CBA1158]